MPANTVKVDRTTNFGNPFPPNSTRAAVPSESRAIFTTAKVSETVTYLKGLQAPAPEPPEQPASGRAAEDEEEQRVSVARYNRALPREADRGLGCERQPLTPATEHVCNLYSVRTSRGALARKFGLSDNRMAAFEPLPAISWRRS